MGQFSWISNEIGSGWVQIELSQPTRIECVVWGRDRLGAFADRLPTSYEIQVAAKPGQWVTVATGADRLKPGETINESPDTRLAEAELVGLVARRQAALDAVAQELPGVPGWTSLDDAIRESAAEAWIMACSTAAHVEVTRSLLAAGKTVLLEKPIAANLESARDEPRGKRT